MVTAYLAVEPLEVQEKSWETAAAEVEDKSEVVLDKGQIIMDKKEKMNEAPASEQLRQEGELIPAGRG